MEWMRRPFGPLGIAACLALVPLSVSADTVDQPYLVTTTTQTASGNASLQNIIVVRAGATDADDDGNNGHARACFGLLQHVLAAGPTNHRPYTIGVALDNATIVAVPLTASSAQPGTGVRLIQANGDAGGDIITATNRVPINLHVDVRVLTQAGQLQAATFREVTYVDTLEHTLSVNTCSVQRLPVESTVSPS
jgi:hypothetical protein